jgi:DNA polymerase-4
MCRAASGNGSGQAVAGKRDNYNDTVDTNGNSSLGRRVIAHVDADAVYASIHLLEDPSLRGKPVVVAWEGGRSIVTTASYEARKYGIRSAQPASQARRLCPHAIFIRPNFDLYRDYSRRAMEIVRAVTPLVEPLSLDEAYLDITDLEKPIAAMRDTVAEIRETVGLQYSVGIGPNKLCAKTLSDFQKPAAFNVASREQCCDIFASESPRLISGIGPKTVEVLESKGFLTIAGVRDAETAHLIELFGERRALELQARCRFEHDGIVSADREIKSQSEETTFEHDIEELSVLDERIRELAADLSQRLQRRSIRGRTIGIKIRHADFTTVTRARTVSDYTDSAEDLSSIASALLKEYAPEEPVRLLGVRVANFEHEQVREDEGRPMQLRLPIDMDALQRRVLTVTSFE